TKAKARTAAAAPAVGAVAARAVLVAQAVRAARAALAAEPAGRCDKRPAGLSRPGGLFCVSQVPAGFIDEWQRQETSLPARRVRADGVPFPFRLRVVAGATLVQD